MPPSLVLLLQNPEFGGAERSLLTRLIRDSSRPLLVLSAPGRWSREAEKRGWPILWVSRPRFLDTLDLRGHAHARGAWKCTSWSMALFWAVIYALTLARKIPRGCEIRTLGVKSHVAALMLLPVWKKRWIADIRDFIRPSFLRKAIAFASRRGWCKVVANSRKVAAAYPGAQVEYPEVILPFPVKPRSPKAGNLVLVHIGYFAPYKGQDLFLRCARSWLAKGLQAEFWMIGDVLYPAPVYQQYAQGLRSLAESINRDWRKKGRDSDPIRLLGALGDVEVQRALEEADWLVHCTHQPEPFGRTVMEALLCGCRALCHKDCGVTEKLMTLPLPREGLPDIPDLLGPDYVEVVFAAEGASTLENSRDPLPAGGELTDPLP